MHRPPPPPNVLRSVCEAIAGRVAPWKAPTCFDPRHTWYVGAAKSQFGYVAAMWGPSLGCRIEILPQWVNSQQTAEHMAIARATKIAAHMKLPAKIRLTGAVGNRWRGRALRRMAHTLRWGRLQVKLRGVRSKMNPADHPSRVFKFPNHNEMHAQTGATNLVATTQSKPHLVPIGWAATVG